MSYVPVSIFGPDDAFDTDRVNRIITNQQALRRDAPKFWYSAYGLQRHEGMKILVGAIDCTSRTSRQRSRQISSGPYFSPNSRPIGFATVSTIGHASVFVKIAQRDNRSANLDRTGMRVTIRRFDPVPLQPSHVVNYMLVGY
jgi:hypothetical protein